MIISQLGPGYTEFIYNSKTPYWKLCLWWTLVSLDPFQRCSSIPKFHLSTPKNNFTNSWNNNVFLYYFSFSSNATYSGKLSIGDDVVPKTLLYVISLLIFVKLIIIIIIIKGYI